MQNSIRSTQERTTGMRIAIAEDENAYAEKLREYLRQYAQDYGQALETACYSDGVSFLDSLWGSSISFCWIFRCL